MGWRNLVRKIPPGNLPGNFNALFLFAGRTRGVRARRSCHGADTRRVRRGTARGTHRGAFNSTPMGGQFEFVWPSARTMHSYGSPDVRCVTPPWGVHRTCGEPNATDVSTHIRVLCYGSLQVVQAALLGYGTCREPCNISAPRGGVGSISPAHLHVRCTPTGRTCR